MRRRRRLGGIAEGWGSVTSSLGQTTYEQNYSVGPLGRTGLGKERVQLQVKGGRVSPANRQEATQANIMMVIIIIRGNGERMCRTWLLAGGACGDVYNNCGSNNNCALKRTEHETSSGRDRSTWGASTQYANLLYPRILVYIVLLSLRTCRSLCKCSKSCQKALLLLHWPYN